MAGIEKSAAILIRTTPEKAFDFVADPRNLRLWQPYVIEAEITSSGGMAAGSTYRYTFRAMGKMIETTGEITEYRPYSIYRYRSTSGPFPIKGGFTFQAVENFVRVTAFGEAEPGSYFSMAGAMIGVLLNRQLKTTLQKLKEVLERS